MSTEPAAAQWGVGKANAGQAKVLFTTHEQLRRRVAECDRFADVKCFHYRGKPRTLRVWDEGLLAAPHACFQVNAMRSLPYAIGASDPNLASAIAKLLPSEDSLALDQTIPIPAALGTLIGVYGRRCEALEPGQKSALEGLSKLAGHDAVVRKDNLYGWVLVGTGKPLPEDIAPLIVMDASAPLMNRYDDWSRYGLQVARISPAQVVYDNAAMHWWDRGCGKSTYAKLDDRNEISIAVADLINAKANERWLIIHHRQFRRAGEKDGELPIDLAARLDKPENVSSLHWGLHCATNAYREVRNIIVLGALEYGAGGYEAISMSALGTTGRVPPPAYVAAIRDGEFIHNLYQAVCRSNIRNSVDGVCGEASVYLVMPMTPQRIDLVERAFKGASINGWAPTPTKKPTVIERVQEALSALLAAAPSTTFKEVRTRCGKESNESYLTRPIKDLRFKAFLKENRIRIVGRSFVRLSS